LSRNRRVCYCLSVVDREVINAKHSRIIRDAEALPVEQRALVVESLLRSLNPPDPEIDRKWADVAKRRLEELRSGRVKPVPGEEVFARIRERFAT
jgi:putative addiction module component (TIGR02574 family)